MSFEFPAWDPVLLDLPGPIDVRWYGLSYLAAFAVAYWVVMRLARRRFLALDTEGVGDLIVYVVLGTILGGRIGYAIFYDSALADPAELVQIWRGGMSFHGGLLGVIAAMALFAWRKKVPFLRVGDVGALATPPGILFVRLANFVNGELYGRVTDAATPGAMRFPTDPQAIAALGLSTVTDTRSRELAIQVAVGHRDWDSIADRVQRVDAYGEDVQWSFIRPLLDWDAARESVPFRHPSQLYEGLAEGLLVGLLVWGAYLATRARPLRAGAYGGLFLLGYGVARFALEYVRQPDAQFAGPDDPLGTVLLGLTMGQTLSSAMVL
ncbi:MAG TPA: prolipoprotein diacylglyceryl transferase, partial [Planctomycetota bacterium]|nr:prolipoprotein diacylglyceryl transferase [Planctomycetota bacterium]